MAAEGDNDFERYIYRGVEGERIPRHVTHVIVQEDVTVVLRDAFGFHPNIVEVICHDKVEKIEEDAFRFCPSLRRVIIPGVTFVGNFAFNCCYALTDVECGKLEIIGEYAFSSCKSLRSINLPSARNIDRGTFDGCEALMDVKFSGKLESIGEGAFNLCKSLGRITIPLKDGLITSDALFMGCVALEHVDLVERAVLHETVAALQLEVWKNDMNEEIDSIHQILLNAPAGGWIDGIRPNRDDIGEKAHVIRRWIRSVLDEIGHYQAEHRRVLDEAATALEQALPRDLVMSNILSFIAVPPHRFGMEDREDAE